MQIITQPRIDEEQTLDALRTAFLSTLGRQVPAPGQSVVDLPDGGDVISYPAVLPSSEAGLFSLKVSPYIPQVDGPPVITAWTLLMSLSTGAPIALIDSAALTVERTAATTALAVDRLLAEGASRAAIIGYGPIGRAHARYIRRIRPELSIVAYSRSQIPSDPDTPVTDNRDEALQDADAVLLCTSAAESVVDPRVLGPGTVVTSISTNAPSAREIPIEAVEALDVYVDAYSTLGVASELKEAASNGWDPELTRGDLAELLGSTARRPSGARPVFFRSVGLGLEDAAVAWAALKAAPEAR